MPIVPIRHAGHADEQDPPVLGGGVENPPGHLQTNISPSDLTTPIPQVAAPSSNGNGPVSTQSPILPYTLIKGISSPIHAQFILNVAIPVFTTTFAHTCSPEDMKAYIASNFTIDHILAEINNPNKRFVLAMQGETCCGFAQLTIGSTEPCLEHIPMRERVELQRIYVGMEFHGGGLGKLLMEAALAMGRAEGYTWVWLGVYEENKRAKRFYEKLGFEMVGTHVFWLGSDEQIDEIYLRKIDP